MAKEIRQTSLDLHNVRTHGRSYVGRVLSSKMNATVTVSWERKIYVPKFERYMVRTSKVMAHNPDSIGATEGDMVRIQQCRPLSKSKNFIVIEKLNGSENDAALEESDSKEKAATKKGAGTSSNTKPKTAKAPKKNSKK